MGAALHSKSGSPGNAAAMGGGREGRPRQSRIFRIVSGGWIAYTILIRPKQLGHSKTSACCSRNRPLTYPLMTMWSKQWYAKVSRLSNKRLNVSIGDISWFFLLQEKHRTDGRWNQ
jgi:four helix bundle protein